MLKFLTSTFLIFGFYASNAQEAKNLKFVKVITISNSKMTVPKGSLWVIQSTYRVDGTPGGGGSTSPKSNFKIAYRPVTLDGKEVWATFPMYLGEGTTVASSEKEAFLNVTEYFYDK